MLSALGIRRRPFRALAGALLLMDLRSQHYGRATATKEGDVIPPFYWVIGQYLLASGLLSVALFARTDAWGYAFAGLSVSMLLTATAIVIELSEVLLATDDAAVLGHRPIPERTYAAARLANLGFFVALLTLAVAIPPAIVGTALRGSGPWFLPAYALAAAGINTATVVVVSAVLVGSARRPGGGMRDALAWSQIVLILVIFYGAQLMLRDEGHQIETFLAAPPDWLAWTPPAWLATFVADAAASGPDTAVLRRAAVVVAASLVGSLFLVLQLVSLYRRIRGSGFTLESHVTATERPLVGPVARWISRSRQERAVSALCFAALRRDQELRMRVLPPLATAGAAVLMGLATGQLGSPLEPEPSRAVLPLAAIQLVVMAVPPMLRAMTFSHDHAGSFLLAAAPWQSRSIPREACRRAVCHAIVLPFLLALGMAYALAWRDPLAAGVVTLAGWLQALAVSHLSLRALSIDLPLSEPAARGDVMGPVGPWLAAVATVGALLVAIQLSVAATWPGAIAFTAALALAHAGARSIATRPRPA